VNFEAVGNDLATLLWFLLLLDVLLVCGACLVEYRSELCIARWAGKIFHPILQVLGGRAFNEQHSYRALPRDIRRY
jgi:hypothetical protein